MINGYPTCWLIKSTTAPFGTMTVETTNNLIQASAKETPQIKPFLRDFLPDWHIKPKNNNVRAIEHSYTRSFRKHTDGIS